jgi:hypothetical protein
MPGFLLHAGATVCCPHAGHAQAIVAYPRITVAGQPVVTRPVAWLVAGCALPSAAGGPCISAEFFTAATRVTSLGQPLLLSDSQATCTYTKAPLQILSTQTRASAT